MRSIKKIFISMLMFCLLAACIAAVPASAAPKRAKAAKVTLDKTQYTLKKGKSITLKADAKDILWSSSDKKIAVVDQKGRVTAKKNGKAKITAKIKNTKKKAVCKITVGIPVSKIKVREKTLTLYTGSTQQIKPSVFPKKASIKKVRYTSNDKKVAAVNAKGKITAKAAGSAKITVTAKDGTGKKAVIRVTVKKKQLISKISLSADKKELEVGDTVALKAKVEPSNAYKKTLSYTSSNPRAAVVTDRGIVTAKAAGKTEITAKAQDGSGKSAKINITVKGKVVKVTSISLDATRARLEVGKTIQLHPKVLPENASDRSVTYTSSDQTIVSVDEKGVITAKKAGTATVTVRAADGSGVTAPVQVEVGTALQDLSLKADAPVISAGETTMLHAAPVPDTAAIDSISYDSPDSGIAAVSSNGTVTGIKNGSIQITASARDPYGNEIKKDIGLIVGTKATGLEIDMTDTVLYTGQTRQLNPTVRPANASKQTVVYESADPQVASVSETGLITAIAPGTTKITVTTVDGGHKKDIQLTVKNIDVRKDASTQEELEQALADETLQALTIQGGAALAMDIPAGDYSDVLLDIQAPQGHIENHGTFQSISIRSIGENTFVEHAAGNDIYYTAPKGTIQIAQEANAKVTLLDGAEKMRLINDGDLAALVLNTAADLSITGASGQKIGVTAMSAAQNARISTDRPLDIRADALLELTLENGAEDTFVTVSTKDQLPSVKGLGRINVNILADSSQEMIVGEHTGEDQLQKVKISGTVIAGTDGLAGALIYVIPYAREIDAGNIRSYLDRAKATTVSDENGNYLTGEMSIGNYYLFVEKEGFQDVLETLILTGSSQEVYYVERIDMVEAGAETGSLTGTLYDAATKAPVPGGITLKIRRGRNDLSSEPLQVTTTSEDGSYRFDQIPAGQYTVQVLDERNDPNGIYITTRFSAKITGGENIANNSITLALSEDQIRFRLWWGDEASGASSDLDSHLIGPRSSSTGQFHTWFSSKDHYEIDGEGGRIHYAGLDVDDTDWEGPETSTIYQRSNGIYHFYIHDYINQSEGSDLLGRSSAVVEVFAGARNIATYNVPNLPGNLWHVCDYDAENDRLIPVNEMSDHTDDLEYIGTDKVEIQRGRLQTKIDRVNRSKSHITDPTELAEVDAILAAAQDILVNGTTEDVLIEQGRILDDWIQTFNERYMLSLAISDITGDEIDSYSYDEDGILDQEVTLYIKGYQETLPAFDVSVPEGSSYILKASDKDNTQQMIVVTAPNGYSCKYYIEHSISSRACSVRSVHAGAEGEELIDDWDTDEGYDEDDEGYHILDIWGYSETLPLDLQIQPRYVHASVEIKDADRPGYEKMVLISCASASRTYYIRYFPSSSFLFHIEKISAMMDGEELIWDQYIDRVYDEKTDGYLDILRIYGTAETLPDTLGIQTACAGTSVEVREADREGYDKMVVLSYPAKSPRIYYIQYEGPSGNG